MIQTNDAAAALRFLIVARRVGLEVVPETGERRDYELECRSPELGEALWWILAGQDELFDARLSLIDVQEFADERRGAEEASPTREITLARANAQRAWAYAVRTNADW